MNERFPVVIPAAGVGKRMQADRPKQYLLLNGEPLLAHTLKKLLAHPKLGQLFLVVNDDDGYVDELNLAQEPRITRVSGGSERVDSVLNGLRAVAQHAKANEWVLVHDAARPCVSATDIDALIQHVTHHQQGGILAYPVRDTMKQASADQPNLVAQTQPREHLWHALTPQMFRLDELTRAIEQGLAQGASITDEASAMEQAGYRVSLVEGCVSNIKVTRPPDLALAEFYLTDYTPADKKVQQ
ncbi:2-C-methyl-D-erythritol 4-phosphate cytidylyltransferase [Alteromonas flava]|uniref:2-C-methyl-D-erythritol 4-phosphate cytidylyltransferase n=1 Tax=Alteromonas flava TaxID=2048003 RepID=UPI000C28979E|nr:2-C-methyl-D-erythritol 4-phosphate cytidylyltransferase [Alteromonas flava]